MSLHNDGQSCHSTIRINSFVRAGGNVINVNTAAGTYKYYHDAEAACMWINYIGSSAKGHGFGTEVIRAILAKSIDQGCPGRIKVDVAWSSHLFYLFMGFIPVDRKISYLALKYGLSGEGAVNALAKLSEEADLGANLALGERTFSRLKRLKEILAEEKELPNEEALTIADLQRERDFLIQLKNKEGSYLSHDFIHQLLVLLEAHIKIKPEASAKYPDSSRFGGVIMTLSEEGKTRWLEAIRENKPFVLFKNFEQLTPFMNNSQRSRLNAVMLKIAETPEPTKQQTSASSSHVLFAYSEQKNCPQKKEAPESLENPAP